MERIVGSREMKDLDAFTIQEKGMPSLVLMERAAMAVKEELEKSFDLDRVLVVCGSGNNGGDGIAAARMLHLAGIRAEIFLAGKKESFTEETGIQWKIAENTGCLLSRTPEFPNILLSWMLYLAWDFPAGYRDITEKFLRGWTHPAYRFWQWIFLRESMAVPDR